MMKTTRDEVELVIKMGGFSEYDTSITPRIHLDALAYHILLEQDKDTVRVKRGDIKFLLAEHASESEEEDEIKDRLYKLLGEGK